MMMCMPSDHLDPAAPTAAPSARRLETRAKLLDAAIDVFAEDGLQGASVEAICTRAGFTRGAFYSNFSSKEQLFLAALTREFEARARDIATKALQLEPMLRERSGCVSPDEAAKYLVDFFAPTDNSAVWLVLETEFLLLAMRDPSIAPGHHQFLDSFYVGISDVVERVLAAAGRRFSVPTGRAIAVLNGVYEQALRDATLAGTAPDREAFESLAPDIAGLLFALTEEVGGAGAAGNGTACSTETA